MSVTPHDADAIEAMVRAAPDADALKQIVAAIGSLPGSRGRIYTAAELIEQIEAAVQAPALATFITRTVGLRDKVLELSARRTEASSATTLQLRRLAIGA
jgi:hypothetical protein